MKKLLPFLILTLCIAAFACHHTKNNSQSAASAIQRAPGDTVVRKYNSVMVKNPVEMDLGNGLKYTVISKGNGPLPKKGETIVALYTGKFTNDTVFDASSKHGFQ